jgi:anti-sigma28 factor (negative regulator of flagellin synthesis)
MEIGDESKIRIQCYNDLATRGKKMSKKTGQNRRSERAQVNSILSSSVNSAPEIRKDKVEEARENIIAGKYKDSKVMDEIVDRLIEQFGL